MGLASSQARLWSQAADPGHTRKAGARHSSGRAHLPGPAGLGPVLDLCHTILDKLLHLFARLYFCVTKCR